jgi:hypothetical protein
VLNYHGRVRGTQTVNNAELQAIEHALLSIPATMSVIIYTDSAFAISSILIAQGSSDNKKFKLQHRHVVMNIIRLMEIRRTCGADTNINKVYSHLEDLSDPKLPKCREAKLKKNLDIMHNRYGEEVTKQLIEGNCQADLLAKMSLNDTAPLGPELTNMHFNFVLSKQEKAGAKSYVTDNFSGNISRIITEKHTQKILKNIGKKNPMQHANITSDKIDKMFSTIFKTKDFQVEKQKLTLFKAVHDRFFTKPRIHKKIKEEATRYRGSDSPYAKYFSNKYSHIVDEQCVFCKRNIEEGKHMFNLECCRWRSDNATLHEKVKEALVDAILVSGDGEWGGVRSKLYDTVKTKAQRWLRFRRNAELQDKSQIEDWEREAIRLPVYADWFANTVHEKSNNEECKKFDIDLYMGKIGILPIGLTTELKLWGLSKYNIFRFIMTVQCILAENIYKIWMRRCQRLSKKNSEVIEIV